MSYELCHPYAVERYNLRRNNLDYSIMKSMRAIFRVGGPEAAPPPARIELPRRQRCRRCRSTLPLPLQNILYFYFQRNICSHENVTTYRNRYI